MITNPHYNPDHLLDMLKTLLDTHSDRHLAARLGRHPSQLSRIRKREIAVTADLLLSMHEETGLAVRQLRALMGDFREHSGRSAKHPIVPGSNDHLECLRKP
jgi:plasmid maintenance system antidote protein VapI